MGLYDFLLGDEASATAPDWTEQQGKNVLVDELAKNSRSQRAGQAWGIIGGALGKGMDTLMQYYAIGEQFELMDQIYGADGIEQTKIDKSATLQSEMIVANKEVAIKTLDTQVEITKSNNKTAIKTAEINTDAKIKINKDKQLYQMFYPRNDYYYGLS